MTDGIEVLQDVLVFDVAIDGAAVLVDVYGGAANVCGSVRLVIDEPDRRRAALATIRRWCHRRAPLTLIISGSVVALQNDHHLFGAQLAR